MIYDQFSDDISNFSIEEESNLEYQEDENANILQNQQLLNKLYEHCLLNRKSIFEITKNCTRLTKTSNSKELLKGKLINYNRKQKSLQELTKKFLSLFVPFQNKLLQLDKVSKQLGIEKRRIYDIINILQSLKIVTRNGKNQYRWNGISKIKYAISQYQSFIESQTSIFTKKQKSLQFLASGFLNLFIRWKKILGLQEAAQKLIVDFQPQKLKTKIRRLYDIANVFKSLGLVKKVLLPNKKPGFEWLGIEGICLNLNISINSQKINQQNNTNYSRQSSVYSIQKKKHISFFEEFFLSQIMLTQKTQTYQNFFNTLNNCIWPKQQNICKKASLNEIIFETCVKKQRNFKDITNQTNQCRSNRQGFSCFANKIDCKLKFID